MLIFGGQTSPSKFYGELHEVQLTCLQADNYLSDLWKYQVLEGSWTWLTSPSTPNSPGSIPATLGASGSPQARAQACTWFDSAGYMWLYGGSITDVNGILASFYIWLFADTIKGTTYLGDFWKRTTSSSTWLWAGTSSSSPVYPAGYNITGDPGARASSTCWMDTSGNLFLYGGKSDETYDDIWVLGMLMTLLRSNILTLVRSE